MEGEGDKGEDRGGLEDVDLNMRHICWYLAVNKVCPFSSTLFHVKVVVRAEYQIAVHQMVLVP